MKHDVAATHQTAVPSAGGGPAYDSLMAYHRAHEVPVDITAGTTATSLGGAVEAQRGTGPSASDLALGTGTGASSGVSTTGAVASAAAGVAAATPGEARAAARMVGGPWTAEELAECLENNGAEGLFVALAARQPAQGIALLKTAGAWTEAVNKLPLGTMSAASSRAVDTLVGDDVLVISDVLLLFKPRFNHEARETSGAWTLPVMKCVWQQLCTLPVTDISQNTVLTTFDAIAGVGGFGPSWVDPARVSTIQLGESNSVGTYLENTVRHEVGHGVHAQIPGPINSWLQNDMQFWSMSFEQWITELGGYPGKFIAPEGAAATSTGAATGADAAATGGVVATIRETIGGVIDAMLGDEPIAKGAGKDTAITKEWKTTLRGLVENFTGTNSWDPNAATPDAGQAPSIVAAWAAMPEPVKNACAQSTSQWYNNYASFQVVGDKRFFLNHWYHQAYSMGPAAFAAVGALGDNYAAMSENEFFATCYAEFFADPAGVRDPSKWGGKLSAEIQSFFRECIVARHPYTAYTAAQTASKETAASSAGGASGTP